MMGATTLVWSAYKKVPGTWIVAIEVRIAGLRVQDLCVVPVHVLREREMRRAANALLELWKIKQGESDG